LLHLPDISWPVGKNAWPSNFFYQSKYPFTNISTLIL
jgi:hypothetical protein